MVNSAIVACLVVTLYAGIQAIPINNENRLAKHLMRKYRRMGLRGRPVETDSQPWNVSFSLILNSIQDVDFEDQTIEVFMWQSLIWKDPYLKWNRSEFDVSSIRLRPSDILMPDITLYNAASEMKTLNPHELLVVQDTGHVMYVPPIQQKALCPMSAESKNITCTLKYGSWTYAGQQLNLTLGRENIDLSTYQVNPHWKLVDTSATRNEVTYACCPEAYIDLTFDIMLMKK